MNIMMKHLTMIKRIDNMIRMRATGGPEEFADKLGISKTKLYRMINIMKSLEAPITYDFGIQSFVYEKAVGFQFGFVTLQQGEYIESVSL